MELLPPNRWLSYARRSRLRILMYHSISIAPTDRLAIRPELFSEQMQFLADHDFTVVSLQQACELFKRNGDLRRRIVLTFDDGYRDFLTTAAPILQEYKFTATLFVVTGRCGGEAERCAADRTRPVLSGSELQQLRTMGYSLGSHTLTHPDLTRLDGRGLEYELSESREAIGSWGESFIPFAYPGGSFTVREREAVDHAGYDCAVIVGGRWGNGPDTDRFLLKREPMLASDTLPWFERRVTGFYEWHYLWARARRIRTR